jgi:hypothetical protein
MTRPLPLALYVMTLPLEECVRTKLRLYHTLCPILPSTIFFLYSKNPHISHSHRCIPLSITLYITRNVIFVSLLRIVWSLSPSVFLSVLPLFCARPSGTSWRPFIKGHRCSRPSLPRFPFLPSKIIPSIPASQAPCVPLYVDVYRILM